MNNKGKITQIIGAVVDVNFETDLPIGSVTPPVGVAYFTAATIAQVRLEKVAVALIPYLVGLFLLLFFILIVPELTMFLPNLLSN